MPEKISKAMQVWYSNSKDPRALLYLGHKYLKSLKVQNYSPDTLYARRYYLGDFVLWCHERKIYIIDSVNEESIKSYQSALAHRPSKCPGGVLSLNSLRQRMKNVGLFFKWLVKKKHLKENPAIYIEFRRPEKRLPCNVLNIQEMERILNTIDISTPFGVRDRAIIETLYSTSMRRGELVALDLSDIDFNQGLVLIRSGKGKKDRRVPIGERAIKWINKYINEMRSKRAKRTEKALFVTFRGIRFSSSNTISYIVKQAMVAAKIERKGSCHVLRHTSATLMLENGASTRYIRDILGHESVITTQIYTQVAITDLKKVYQQTHEEVNIADKGEVQFQDVKIPYKRGILPGSKVKPDKFWDSQQQGNFIALAKKYLEWMKEYGYRETTIRINRYFLRHFICWCHDRQMTEISQISSEEIENYQAYVSTLINSRTKQPLSAKHCSDRVLAVLLFCRWLTKNKYFSLDPGENVELPKLPKQLPREALTCEELERLFAIPDTSTHEGVRDRAILETFYATGIRRMELTKLQLSDLDTQRNTLTIMEGKGKKMRVIPISEHAVSWIEKYITLVRPHYQNEHSGQSLFLNWRGLPISIEYLASTVKSYFKRAGIDKNGTSHLFRNGLATRMLEKGVDIRHIQSMLGHNTLDSTERYTLVIIGKLKEIHTRTHPARMHPTKTDEIIAEVENSQAEIDQA